MNVGDQIGLGQTQKIVAALEIFAVIGEPLAAKIRFAKFMGLDHRPHSAVENDDSLGQ